MTDLHHFQNIASGAALPPLTVAIDRAALVRFAGAADDYTPQHWDHPFMVTAGYPDVIVHGWLVFAHLCRMVTLWARPEVASVAGYAVRYHRPFHPGVLHCEGEVTEVMPHEAHLDLRARNEKGVLVTRTSMTIVPTPINLRLRQVT